MTITSPAAGPHDTARLDDTAEPPRFAAYADGGPGPVGTVERMLALVERLLVPGLTSRTARSTS